MTLYVVARNKKYRKLQAMTEDEFNKAKQACFDRAVTCYATSKQAAIARVKEVRSNP